MVKTPAELIMERETQVTYGPVPKRLLDDELADMSWQFRDGEFLLRAIGEHYFHYRRGQGVTIERSDKVDASEESLWLNGSVYAAIASLNGLVPIHASAVAANGAVYAFTAPAGGGKSTVVAALGDRGFPMFCDDTLVLDFSDPQGIACLPGHKRLKLTSRSLELTGAVQQEKVSADVQKFYARSASGDVGTVMPLCELIFLHVGPNPAITPIAGFERFQAMQDDHYTRQLYAGAQSFDRTTHFAHLAALASKIAMARFIRPLDQSRFSEGMSVLADYLAQHGGNGQTFKA
jgi:hypothetical protein